jgi:hypothetical protein
MADPLPIRDALLDIRRILDVLAVHDVDFVVVGGIAAVLAGSPLATEDFDLTPAAEMDNLERLAAALNDLGAQWRVPGLDEGFPPPQPLSAAVLTGMQSAAFVTRAGLVDVVLRHSDGAGHREVAADASSQTVHGHPVRVASLDRLISSKTAADRDKDRRALPLLRELRRRQQPG